MPVAVPVQPPQVELPHNIKLGSTDVQYGDFRDELFSKGWAVVPDVMSAEAAAGYVSRAHDWLESFGLGYKRDDPATWTLDQLPYNDKGGLYGRYGVGHEQFLWDIRQEPGLIAPFAKIWGTSELLVSFDGCNLSVPLKAQDEKTQSVFKPWAHVDQSPLRKFLHCIQGIANLAPNGPDDGGLMVFEGSRELYNECFELFDYQKPAEGWSTKDSYHHTPEMLEWLASKGCKWHKVCAPAGSLILWDSRTVHYGAPPRSDAARMASYVCYKPANLITPELLAIKKSAFENLQSTSHDPVSFAFKPTVEPQPNDPGWKVRHVPDNRPVLSEVGRKLAGLEPY